MRRADTRMHVVRLIYRSDNYAQLLILGKNLGLVITTCFHVHELPTAMYGCAGHHIPVPSFNRYQMRPTNTPMHVVRAINRSVNYAHS